MILKLLAIILILPSLSQAQYSEHYQAFYALNEQAIQIDSSLSLSGEQTGLGEIQSVRENLATKKLIVTHKTPTPLVSFYHLEALGNTSPHALFQSPDWSELIEADLSPQTDELYILERHRYRVYHAKYHLKARGAMGEMKLLKQSPSFAAPLQSIAVVRADLLAILTLEGTLLLHNPQTAETIQEISLEIDDTSLNELRLQWLDKKKKLIVLHGTQLIAEYELH